MSCFRNSTGVASPEQDLAHLLFQADGLAIVTSLDRFDRFNASGPGIVGNELEQAAGGGWEGPRRPLGACPLPAADVVAVPLAADQRHRHRTKNSAERYGAARRDCVAKRAAGEPMIRPVVPSLRRRRYALRHSRVPYALRGLDSCPACPVHVSNELRGLAEAMTAQGR